MRASVLGGLAAALLLTACVGVGRGGTPEGEARIDMKDSFFTRDVTRVQVGSPVTFRNSGRIDHNAIAVDGSFSTVEATGQDVMAADPTGSNSCHVRTRQGLLGVPASLPCGVASIGRGGPS